MSNFPQTHYSQRPTRVRPAEFIPAVLRSDDGSCTSGELATFSLTGGLLSLPELLHQGARTKLMFLTQTGPVLGVAELLKPVSRTQQPFRFVLLHESDQRRLWAATQSGKEPGTAVPVHQPVKVEPPTLALETTPVPDAEQSWIEKYRAAIDGSPPQRRRFPRIFFAVALTAATLGLGIMYALQAHLLR